MPSVAAPPVDLIGARPSEQHQRLLRTLRKQFAQATEADSDNRRMAVEAQDFLNGNQWPEMERQKRRNEGRPCLTVNTLKQYKRQITNGMRARMPAITVLPVGHGADVETARIHKGLIRHIEQASDAEVVRQSAFDSAVDIGWGFYRIMLEYDDWTSFDQEPRLGLIRNHFQVYMDPHSQWATGQDAQWVFNFEEQDKEAFQDEWGVDGTTIAQWSSLGDTWIQKDTVRVAEYFWKDLQRVTLGQTQDGETLILEAVLLAPLQEFPQLAPVLQPFVAWLMTPTPRYLPLLDWIRGQARQAPQRLDGLPPAFVAWYVKEVLFPLIQRLGRVRPTEHCTVRWIKTNGYVILEESIWPGKYLPFIRMVGEELYKDGQMLRTGIVTPAMDPIRLRNYWVTMQAEHIALSPVPPWLIAEGQIPAQHQQTWASANTKPHAYLPYKPLSIDGQPVPPPIRNAYEPPIQAITVAMQTAEEYTQQAVGIYLGTVGGPSKERSGKAILAKDEQADTGTFHFADNMAHAMRYEAMQYLDLIPKVLTPGKIQRIVGDDGAAQQIVISQPGQPRSQEQLPEGIAGVYDLTSGTYDAIVDVGPSYETKRQEAADQLMQLTTALPEAMATVIWKVVDMQDWEGAGELSDLLKRLPNQILDEVSGGNKDMFLAQLQQQLPQLQQQLQAINAYAQQQETMLQKLAGENETLKQHYHLKLADLELKQKELDHQISMDRATLAIEREKVAMQRDAAEEESDGRTGA